MKTKFNKLNLIWIILILFFLIEGVIYYHTPYNPLTEVYDSGAEIKYAEYQILFHKLLVTRTEEYGSEVHYEILKYFADMDMVPLDRYSRKERTLKYPSRFLMFNVGDPYNKAVMIRFISPNVFRISSDDVLEDGYYEIQGQGVDFIYLTNTLKENNF
ncbi:MAG: hypothetical protein N4A40_03045 [Tissierellales bacterium]|jgi:hypothetical protein|nr:hypothetical protein [Tissierellales bacterium]